MDDHLAADAPVPSPEVDSAVLEKTSTQYVGRWTRLVSTTNWEKGRIISEWRLRVMETGAPRQACSDEAWSQRVGHVSPQHVGRLRRVYERFGRVYKQYQGLFWSHFLAAVDWHDAEMWLEGAVQNRWSVAQMRTTRWDAMGAPADKKPRPEDIVAGEWDEDVDAGLDESTQQPVGKSMGMVHGLDADEAGASDASEPAAPMPVDPFQPFEDHSALPKDLAKAYEYLKRAILRHRRSGWRKVSLEQVLAALDALKDLAQGPARS